MKMKDVRIEVDELNISKDRLESFIDFLAEILANEYYELMKSYTEKKLLNKN